MNTFTEKEALSILISALELPKEGQQPYISSKCAGRQELHERVETLLKASEESDSIPAFPLNRPGGAAAGQLPIEILTPLKTSAAHNEDADSVGPYRLMDVIGEGGMGVVYLAEQHRPKRKVALKVIQPLYLTSESSQRRFEREAYLLGRLDHPGIARIYNAGTATVKGMQVPFIAMELVDGTPLRKYVDSECQNLTDQLLLIAKIADGVHSAHQKAVVHRDLKPENILITKSGQPKILDFGIAASTDIYVDQTHRTQAGQILGTFAYMSPEQARCDIDAIDARSDIYSLGLIAYEILTGQPAFETAGSPFDALVRGLERGEPKALGRINPNLRGDIEAIVGKACREEPAARYDSAAALAADIRSFVEFRPISARPLSRAYELRKLVRRNRVVVGAAMLLALSITCGLFFYKFETHRANRNEAMALDKAEGLERVTQFQAQRLSNIDVAKLAIDFRHGLIQKVREASSTGLDKSATDKRAHDLEQLVAGADFTGLSLETLYTHIFEPALLEIDAGFEDRPHDQAHLFQTMATTLRELGLLEEAFAPQARAIEIRTFELDDTQEECLYSRIEAGLLLLHMGEFDEARRQFEQVLEMNLRAFGELHPNTLAIKGNLAGIFFELGDMARAKELQEQVLDVSRQTLGETHPDTLTAMGNLAVTLMGQGNAARAIELQEQVLEESRRVHGEEHPRTLTVMHNFSHSLKAQGDLAAARKLQELVLNVSRRVHGDGHPFTLKAKLSLTGTMTDEGDLVGAREIGWQVLEARRQVLGEEHPDTLIAMGNFAMTLKGLGEGARAQEIREQILEVSQRTLGNEHPNTLIAMDNLGASLRAQGDVARGIDLQLQALEVRRRVLGEKHPITLRNKESVAMALRDKGDHAGAQVLLEQVMEVKHRTLGEEHPDTLKLMLVIAIVMRNRGDLDNDHHERTVVLLRRVYGNEHTDTLHALVSLARKHADKGDRAKALKIINEVTSLAPSVWGAEHDMTKWVERYAKKLDKP